MSRKYRTYEIAKARADRAATPKVVIGCPDSLHYRVVDADDPQVQEETPTIWPHTIGQSSNIYHRNSAALHDHFLRHA